MAAITLSGTNLFVYCANNPVSSVDKNGEWVHIAVGAVVGGLIGAVSAASSSINTYGRVDVVNVVIGFATGAVGGALAASGVGLIGQIAGSAAIASVNSALSQARDVSAHNQEWSWSKLAVDTAIGAISGLIGGKGASYGNAKSITNLGRGFVSRISRGENLIKASLYYLKSANAFGGKSVFTNLGEALGKGYVVSKIASWLQ